jgi:hypothetical protein
MSVKSRLNPLFLEPLANWQAYPCAFLKRAMLLPRSFRIIRQELDDEDDSKSHSPLVYLGEGESLRYIASLLNSSFPAIGDSTYRIYDLSRLIRCELNSGRIVVAEVNRLFRFLFPAGGAGSCPWIRQRVPLSLSGYFSRRRKIEGTYGRKVRQHHLESCCTQDPGQVEFFYRQLYLPYVQARFGGQAHLRELRELQQAVRSGFLLQVRHEGKWVSGSVCRTEGVQIQAVAFGVNWRDEREWHNGALAAAYYFLLKNAIAQGMEIVDLMRSRPNGRDGVYIHKSRWGAHPSLDPWPHTWLQFYIPPGTPLSPSLASFLVWNGTEFQPLSERVPVDLPGEGT